MGQGGSADPSTRLRALAAPNTGVVALLLRACGEAVEPELLQTFWAHLQPAMSGPGRPPPHAVLVALVDACVNCDLAAYGVRLGGGSSGAPRSSSASNQPPGISHDSSDPQGGPGASSSGDGQPAAAAALPPGGVSAVLFDPDSYFAVVLGELETRCATPAAAPSSLPAPQRPLGRHQQQQHPRQRQQPAAVPAAAPAGGLPGPLLAAEGDSRQAVALLRLAASADDVSTLLSSRLFCSHGALLPAARPVQTDGGDAASGSGPGMQGQWESRPTKQQRTPASSSSAGSSSSGGGTGLGSSAFATHLPAASGQQRSPLPPTLAAEAVRAYARHSAWGRAAAVAHAANAAAARPDTQAWQLFVQLSAAHGPPMAAISSVQQMEQAHADGRLSPPALAECLR